jgi:hypothetical protein
MRATSPSGSAEFEGRVQWSGELGFGVRSPEAGQTTHRDDAATGSQQLRHTLERHLRPGDLPAAKRGPRGAIGRMLEKAERFAPGAGKKHRAQADDDYAAAVEAGNSERDQSGTATPRAGRSEPTDTGQTSESSGP